jgi:PleD family two-component response regulator
MCKPSSFEIPFQANRPERVDFNSFDKFFAIFRAVPQSLAMTEPMALVFYEKLIPGQQLVNRLQDTGYRVQAVTDINNLEGQVQKLKPMLLVAEFQADNPAVHQVIGSLKQNPATAHVPILAYAVEADAALQETARKAGANLIANEEGLLDQLPQLLEQVLQVE